MIAIGRAHAIAAGGSSPDAMVAHLALDPPAADGLSPGTERCMNSGRAVSFPVAIMNPPDVAQKPAIGHLARALRYRDRHA